MNPFDYVNDITFKKSDVIRNSENPELAEKQYVPFMVNRALSYFPDTILYANDMNVNSHLDHLMQFDYLINSIKPRKRFSKWHKKQQDETIELIQEAFGYSLKKAIEISRLLTEDDIAMIKQQLQKGGKDD